MTNKELTRTRQLTKWNYEEQNYYNHMNILNMATLLVKVYRVGKQPQKTIHVAVSFLR